VTALDSSRKVLRKGGKIWSEVGGEVVRTVAFCITRQQPLVGPTVSHQRGLFMQGVVAVCHFLDLGCVELVFPS